MKIRLQLVALLVIVASLLTVKPAYAACQEWTVACIFGVTDIANRDAERREKEKDIDKQIQAQQAVANQQLELIKNAHYADDNRRQIAIRDAELANDRYNAELTAWKERMMNAFDNQTKALIEAGHDQANIAQRGIVEAAKTSRSNLAWEGSYNIITVIVIGIVLLAVINRRQKQLPQQPTIVIMQQEPSGALGQAPIKLPADVNELWVQGRMIHPLPQARTIDQIQDKRQYLQER